MIMNLNAPNLHFQKILDCPVRTLLNYLLEYLNLSYKYFKLPYENLHTCTYKHKLYICIQMHVIRCLSAHVSIWLNCMRSTC